MHLNNKGTVILLKRQVLHDLSATAELLYSQKTKKTTATDSNMYHDFFLISRNMSTAYISVQKYVQM